MPSPVTPVRRSRLTRAGRWDNLRRIEALDPETDYDEIVSLTARWEFPWDFVQGTGIAFLRDYGVPSISRLLARTREFEDHGVKRYDDTLVFQEEAAFAGIDSERARVATERLNRIHGHYRIPDHEFRYVLATTLVCDVISFAVMPIAESGSAASAVVVRLRLASLSAAVAAALPCAVPVAPVETKPADSRSVPVSSGVSIRRKLWSNEAMPPLTS